MTVFTRTSRRSLDVGPRRLRRLPDYIKTPEYTAFELVPHGPLIGAEIRGVDLREPLTEDVRKQLDDALLEWKVIFFRDQPVTSEQQRDFARNWGGLEVNPYLKQGETPEVVRFEKGPDSPGRENVWHTDVTWREEPALGTVLRAVEIPEAGGDTMFADMAAAYDGLPAKVRARVDELAAVHDFAWAARHAMSKEAYEKRKAEFPPVVHPLVRVHPVTGRRSLYLNEVFIESIPGLEQDEAEDLLSVLFAQTRVPEFQMRFRWEVDSVVFWDNRAVQHYGVNDYYPNRRVVERVSILGDRPYGPYNVPAGREFDADAAEPAGAGAAAGGAGR
ncbi:TauD/TfdA dioxygenase family protein [Yinghuangia soli]|uniref:TauD/TfdA family dioxygenase n=1 Tax=Yinghuangia soli TaxID=2908204 RepID=A0AA41Q3L7_9ACTN|nr:TauD/TfdA family dioxygenase [Yinghuangia soli]MCF2530696.1 TauD/TfdA family dioxygenase [Yinghuangia soli]